MAVLGLGLLLPLVVAGLLVPSPLGLGTHQELGLPPCTMVMLCGCRCPTCGMTTAWAHMVRGQVVAAVEANSGGAVLALLDMLAVPWLLASAALGRWLAWTPDADAGLWIMLAVMGLTLVDWSIRLLVR